VDAVAHVGTGVDNKVWYGLKYFYEINAEARGWSASQAANHIFIPYFTYS
jgi:hypothetical protein